jgi:hypothetical protein
VWLLSTLGAKSQKAVVSLTIQLVASTTTSLGSRRLDQEQPRLKIFVHSPVSRTMHCAFTSIRPGKPGENAHVESFEVRARRKVEAPYVYQSRRRTHVSKVGAPTTTRLACSALRPLAQDQFRPSDCSYIRCTPADFLLGRIAAPHFQSSLRARPIVL